MRVKEAEEEEQRQPKLSVRITKQELNHILRLRESEPSHQPSAGSQVDVYSGVTSRASPSTTSKNRRNSRRQQSDGGAIYEPSALQQQMDLALRIVPPSGPA